jgi:uncharacterized protein YjbI with pentapeptide repeats
MKTITQEKLDLLIGKRKRICLQNHFFRGLDFSDGYFPDADFSGSIFDTCNLSGIIAPMAKFCDNKFFNSIFDGADLSGASFFGSNIEEEDLLIQKANIEGALFDRDIKGVNFGKRGMYDKV